jgi:hypothetical protein
MVDPVFSDACSASDVMITPLRGRFFFVPYIISLLKGRLIYPLQGVGVTSRPQPLAVFASNLRAEVMTDVAVGADGSSAKAPRQYKLFLSLTHH